MTRDPAKPWMNDHWVTSPYNFASPVVVPAHPVELHDITIRDGEECADLTYNVADKLRIAQALARAGLRRSELFLTVPGWLESVRAIVKECPELALHVNWHPGRVERAMELGVKHVMVWYRIGEVYQQHVLRKSPQVLMDAMLESVRAARQAGAQVNLFMPESTRASLEHILQACQAAEKEGASAATIVDSLGVARPAALRYLVEQVKTATHMKVEVHCHNDFGLAVANVLAAYEGGADALHVSVNGVGYRAGGAALESVVMALEALYGVDTGIVLDRLPELSRLVAHITGIPLAYFQPVIGEGAFAYEQWNTIASLRAAGQRRYAFPFEPELVGRNPRLVVGKWSDAAAVVEMLARLGMKAAPDQVTRILERCQRAAVASHRPLQDAEFLNIAEDEGAQTDV